MGRVVIGTRGSKLALWQARHVGGLLSARDPDLEVVLEVIRTEGDRRAEVAPLPADAKGLFVREIEEALLDRRIDLAVHSLKDLPTEQPAGLCLPVVLERHDPADAIVSVAGWSLDAIPKGAVVGTGSPRRRSQLLHARPDLTVAPVRGNVDTRIARVRDGRFDAVVLAVAGIERLGIEGATATRLSPDACIPAVGQGALVIEVREDDAATRALVGPLLHEETRRAVFAERAFLRRVGGGCLAPATAYARRTGDLVRIDAMVGDPAGRRLLREHAVGPIEEADLLAETLAVELLRAGGDEILRQARASGAAV